MNILILNGSPKGPYSITLQTCLYLEILHPEHRFTVLDVGKNIRSLEKDFTPAAKALEQAELLLFSYPVYTFLVPSQLHRFMELMKKNRVDVAGKAATQISTSKHFYDFTAHAFIRDNCADLGLHVIRGLSADMDDLTEEKGRRDAEAFFDYVIWSVENGVYERAPEKAAAPRHLPVTVPPAESVAKPGDVVIVADLAPEDARLSAMIRRFTAVSPKKVRLVNLHDFPFRGGCISCFSCAKDGTCIWKDGFSDLLRKEIQQAEAVVIAFSVRDHSMGALFKTYDDRQFCNGHRTVTAGMPFGYLVSGNLSREENLRTVIRARAEVGGNFLAGVADDEADPDAEIDRLALRLAWAVDQHYTPPADFRGVGGMKIFRDLIWQMRGLMRADHRFYKARGLYDFPQKKPLKALAMFPVGWLMNSKKLKAKMGGRMNEGMILPYRKVLEKAKSARTGT